MPIQETKNLVAFLKRFRIFVGLIVILYVSILVSPCNRKTGFPIFLEIGNLTSILRQVSEIGIMALAITFVILTGGIDLSVGSVLALSASVVALIITGEGLEFSLPFFGNIEILANLNETFSPNFHILIAIGATLLLASMVGAANGLVIARLRLQPFIATLAAMIGIRGLAKFLTQNANIDLGFEAGVSSYFALALSYKPVVIGEFLVLAVIFSIALSRTVFGRYVRALGDNALASRYAGLPVRRVQVLVYTLSGCMAGLAGVIHCAQNHQGSPNAGVAYELDAIAAVVIGGTSLAGGKGTIVGTIVGTLIMGVLTNIFRLNGIDINAEMMIKAVIIIAAVWLQQSSKS